MTFCNGVLCARLDSPSFKFGCSESTAKTLPPGAERERERERQRRRERAPSERSLLSFRERTTLQITD